MAWDQGRKGVKAPFNLLSVPPMRRYQLATLSNELSSSAPAAPTAVAAAMDLKVTDDGQLSWFDEVCAATGPIERFELMLMRPLEGTRVGVSPGRAIAFMRGMVPRAHVCGAESRRNDGEI